MGDARVPGSARRTPATGAAAPAPQRARPQRVATSPSVKREKRRETAANQARGGGSSGRSKSRGRGQGGEEEDGTHVRARERRRAGQGEALGALGRGEAAVGQAAARDEARRGAAATLRLRLGVTRPGRGGAVAGREARVRGLGRRHPGPARGGAAHRARADVLGAVGAALAAVGVDRARRRPRDAGEGEGEEGGCDAAAEGVREPVHRVPCKLTPRRGRYQGGCSRFDRGGRIDAG